MSQDSPPTKQVKMHRPEINKHGSDQVITNPKKMTPFIDTVKTMENSLAGKEDLDERGGDQLSLGIIESTSRKQLEEKHVQSGLKAIKLTPLKASVHKITNTNTATQRQHISKDNHLSSQNSINV